VVSDSGHGNRGGANHCVAASTARQPAFLTAPPPGLRLQSTEQQQITPKILTLHADRGAPQRAKPVAFLLADLGITQTHSRPYTSSDNPYSESNFKTLKYRTEFPETFNDIEHARAHCRQFFHYNYQHRHSGIGLMTPAAVDHGQAPVLHAARGRVLDAAYQRHPERFVRKPPVPPGAADCRVDQRAEGGRRSLISNAKRLTELDRLRGAGQARGDVYQDSEPAFASPPTASLLRSGRRQYRLLLSISRGRLAFNGFQQAGPAASDSCYCYGGAERLARSGSTRKCSRSALPERHVSVLGVGGDERMAPARAAVEVGELWSSVFVIGALRSFRSGRVRLRRRLAAEMSLGSRAKLQPIRRATCSQRGTPLVASTASTLHAPTAVALVAA